MADPLALEGKSTEDPSMNERLTETDPQALEKLRDLAIVQIEANGATIDVDDLRLKCPLDHFSNSMRNPSQGDTATAPTISQLDRLPLETMQNVFENLDLQTLTDLRRVSRRAMSTVDSLLQYKEIMTHVPDVLRVMLSTKLARHFTLNHVCSELRSDQCYLCGSFGRFLFIPDCVRCCWLCLCEAEATLPISRAQAKESFELTDDALSQQPTMLSLPGSHGGGSHAFRPGGHKQGPNIYRSRVWLVSMWAARLAATDLHGNQKAMDAYMSESRRVWIRAYARQGRWKNSFDQPRIAKPPFPPYIRGPRVEGLEPRRFMTAIRFPMLDSVTGKTEWGVSCLGCQSTHSALNRQSHAVYTKLGFLRHVDECRDARRIWDRTSRPPCIKVLKKLIEPRTLDAFVIPRKDSGEASTSSVQKLVHLLIEMVDRSLIKRRIPEHEQDILFERWEHTRRLDVPCGRWTKEPTIWTRGKWVVSVLA